ncbi:nuclear transport factor 2 family protein [Sphingosinicella sp. CPCC 101087]|uniref:nuclear transport factor 2 family protein n=1 Tax=Sphingosinicella sp. CPCC 101087 TaxID=2497754 RepID=UPI00101CB97E|nr:nuclear transport factor 2 family protein [Sphingosinicella sp. CPCC 101087]
MAGWILGLIAGVAAAGMGPAASSSLAQPAVEEVIAAERAFAEETRKHGFKRGFLAFAATDGFIFQPGPTPARPLLQALPDEPPAGPPLSWSPQFAGAAVSGDLGFTTGGASIPVRYFTVWQRQPGGEWRWIYDGGPGLDSVMASDGDGEVVRLAPATAAAGSPQRALAELAPIEADLAAAAERDAVRARLDLLAEDGLVGGSRTPSFSGRTEQEMELARQPRRLSLRPLGGVASQAGDLAFTWGEARWTAGEDQQGGHSARIWQKRHEGWRLIVDLLIPAPPPA